MPSASTAAQPCYYQPRDAFQSPLWRIVSDHLEVFAREYDSRFLDTHGPWRPEVEQDLLRFTQCGDPNCGVCEFHCDACKITVAVPFSCKTRICPSCVARRAEQTSMLLGETIPPVSHRHLVISLPMKMGIRARIQEDRRLLRKIARIITRVLKRCMRRWMAVCYPGMDVTKARPGIIMAEHTWGDDIGHWHPHFHLVVSDGLYMPDGRLYTLWDWQPDEIREALRKAVLKAMVGWERLHSESAERMQTWDINRSGFSVFVGSVVPKEDRPGLERLLRYLLRPPIALDRLTYDEKTGKVWLRLNRGGEREYAHAVEFLADLSLHVPPRDHHTVVYVGHYANATGNLNPKPPPTEEGAASLPVTKRSRWVPWSRLIARCWQLDPEMCPRCGNKMRRSGPVIERLNLVKLLKALGRFGYPVRPPPLPPHPLPSEHPCSAEGVEFDDIAQPFYEDTDSGQNLFED